MDTAIENQKAWIFLNNSIDKYKKISHAYLIETNGYDKCEYFIKEMIKKILCTNITDDEMKKKIIFEIDNNSYPDIKYIDPDGYWIKKEQLISLEKEFSKKSMLDNKLIYVINGAEKLNDSSANTILKFLEEPSNDIVAILITNNRYKVIDTIVSRCQVLSLINNENEIETSEAMIQFIDDLLKKEKMIINYNYYLENLFTDKIFAKKNIEELEKVFYFYLNGHYFEYIDNKKYSLEIVINILSILNKQKNKLDYNVNIKLWLNELIVGIIEVM